MSRNEHQDLSTINDKPVKSRKFAAYDQESGLAYNDVCTTVSLTRDAGGANSLLATEMMEDFKSPETGAKTITKLAKEFVVNGTRYLYEKNQQGDAAFDFVTSETSSSHTNVSFNPLAALQVPSGEPSRIENGLPVFKSARGDVYTSLDRIHILKVVGSSTTGNSIETTYKNFVNAPDGKKLPTEITTVRSFKGKPTSSISFTNVTYKPSTTSDIAALYEATRAQFKR